jgi:hypothetical protein
VSLELKRVGTICKRRSVLARVRGPDNHYVSEFRLSADGRSRGVDTRPPFAIRLRSSKLGRPSSLRALVVLKDGRRLTIDRTAQGC